MLLFSDILLRNLNKVGQGHNGTTNHKIIKPFFVLCPEMGRMAVGQSYGIGHLLCYPYLLACAIDEFEFCLWKHDGQWNSGKAATRTEIQDARAGTERYGLGYGQRVQHMMLI